MTTTNKNNGWSRSIERAFARAALAEVRTNPACPHWAHYKGLIAAAEAVAELAYNAGVPMHVITNAMHRGYALERPRVWAA